MTIRSHLARTQRRQRCISCEDESGQHQMCHFCEAIICRNRKLYLCLHARQIVRLHRRHQRCSSNGLFSRGLQFSFIWICNNLNRPKGDTMQAVIMWHNGAIWETTAAHISLSSSNDIGSVIMEIFAHVAFWKLIYCEFKAFSCLLHDQIQMFSLSLTLMLHNSSL